MTDTIQKTSKVVYIKDSIGDENPIVAYNLQVTENLMELTQLTFNFNGDQINRYAVDMLQPRTLIWVPEIDEWFRYKNLTVTPTSKMEIYTVTAFQVGTDLNDKYVESRLKGSHSLKECLDLLTQNTKFSYNIHDNFNNYSFSDDGFGGDFADTLLMNTLKDDFKFEYYFDKYTIHIYKKLGTENQFVFVDGFNVSNVARTVDATNVRTHIKGYGKQDDKGKYLATAEYTSPNADVWGSVSAAPIVDDRFTNNSSLLAYIKSQIQDYPLIQYTVEKAYFFDKVNRKLSDDSMELIRSINNVKVGNSGLLKDRFGKDVDVRIIGMTYFPQDTMQNDTVTFGNKLFDANYNMATQKNARKANESMGKDISNSAQVISDIQRGGLWFTYS